MKYFNLLLCLLFSYTVISQDHLLFNEQFDDNQNRWVARKTEVYETKVENGSYIIDTKSSLRNFYQELYLNPKEDYYIETKITLLDQGKDNYGYGLLWASSGSDKYYFDISKGGYFLIYGYINEETVYYKEWTFTEIINRGGTNVLAIRKTGNTTIFFINGKEVHRQEGLKVMGKYTGFTVGSKTKVAIDYLIVKHPATPINLVPNVEMGYVKENLGPNVNSEADELHPLVSHDGKTLYVTRDEYKENIGEKRLQDIWMSKLQADNTWGPAVQMPAPLNTDWHNSITSVSPDNNTLFMDMDEGDETGDKQGLYFSHRTATGWTTPEEVIIDDYYNYNQYESYHISANRKTMITSLERDDTYGEKDLYVCFLQPDGSWSAPKNLGDDVNTFAEDMTPFLAADNKTLYFASYGYPGYGSADIYMTRRKDNTWTNWTKPQNLGPEINSKGWDAYFTISAKGDYAYMVSYDEGGHGGGDAFRIKLADNAKPYPVVWISGVVYDQFSNQPMQAEIRYDVLGRPEESGVALSDHTSGYYQIVLPLGESYDLRASAPGHVAISEHIEIDGSMQTEEIKKDLYLEPIAVGKVFNLKNVLFERGTDKLISTSYQELDKLVALMKENPSLEIELGGHTDNRGDRNALLELSTMRVEAVEAYLVEKGIDEARITGKGYGRSKPITKNRNEDERMQNRRVEFKVTGY